MPRQQAGVHHERVGRGTFAGEFGHFAEDDGEHQHGGEGLDERPGQADDGLFVADGDVAPGEHEEEFAVSPQVAPVVFFGEAGFYYERLINHIDLNFFGTINMLLFVQVGFQEC